MAFPFRYLFIVHVEIVSANTDVISANWTLLVPNSFPRRQWGNDADPSGAMMLA